MSSCHAVAIEELVELVFACPVGHDPDDFGKYCVVLLFTAGLPVCFVRVGFLVDGGEAFSAHIDFQEPVPFVFRVVCDGVRPRVRLQRVHTASIGEVLSPAGWFRLIFERIQLTILLQLVELHVGFYDHEFVIQRRNGWRLIFADPCRLLP